MPTARRVRARRRRLRGCAHLGPQWCSASHCAKWTHWGLSPGPSACEADVIPLHHVPIERHRSHSSIARRTGLAASDSGARMPRPRAGRPALRKSRPPTHCAAHATAAFLRNVLSDRTLREGLARICTTIAGCRIQSANRRTGRPGDVSGARSAASAPIVLRERMYMDKHPLWGSNPRPQG